MKLTTIFLVHFQHDMMIITAIIVLELFSTSSCSCLSACLNAHKDKEFIFRNLENGISLFNADTLETKLLMDNSSFVSTKILKFNGR